ncbi:hypothetical protein [Moorena sp. SIO2C4]
MNPYLETPDYSQVHKRCDSWRI